MRAGCDREAIVSQTLMKEPDAFHTVSIVLISQVYDAGQSSISSFTKPGEQKCLLRGIVVRFK